MEALLLTILVTLVLGEVAHLLSPYQENWSCFMATAMGTDRGTEAANEELLNRLGEPTHKVGFIWYFKDMPADIIAYSGGAFYLPSQRVICVSKNKKVHEMYGLVLPNKELIAHEMGHRFFHHSNMTNWLIANINECLADTFSMLYCRNTKIIDFILPLLEGLKYTNTQVYNLHLIRVKYLKLIKCLFGDVKC